MERFAEKLRTARTEKHLSQTELSERVGVSRRSIFAYENGASLPRKAMLRKLAAALGVTVQYLTDDAVSDPSEGRAREEQIGAARERFGAKGAREAAELLDRNSAFFAGGDIPQEDKDAFFEAIMTAYVTAKTEARRRYASGSRREAEE